MSAPTTVESARRARLARLDDLLQELERVNLGYTRLVPVELLQQLRAEAIQAGFSDSVTTLIDRVFTEQSPLMVQLPDAPAPRHERPLDAISPSKCRRRGRADTALAS